MGKHPAPLPEKKEELTPQEKAALAWKEGTLPFSYTEVELKWLESEVHGN